MANAKRLLKVLEYIRDHRDEWDQITFVSRYSCGTSCCFAGHAVRVGKLRGVDLEDHFDVRSRAIKYLGLKDDEIRQLFNSNFSNNFRRLGNTVRKIIKGDFR